LPEKYHGSMVTQQSCRNPKSEPKIVHFLHIFCIELINLLF